MEVTGKILNTLWSDYYSIVSERMETKTVTNPIPYTTGIYESQFPTYLKGFEDYYEKVSRFAPWRLKDKKNRPCYTITVSYPVYDIKLKPNGEKEFQRRYQMHKRNMEKYARLLGTWEG